MASRVCFCSFIFIFFFFLFASIVVRSASAEFVLTLDASNFSDTVNKHSFIVVEFYAPWCGYCKSLAPEYEKAAAILSNHDPPIILAKVDAYDEINKGLAGEFKVRGYPTIKILREGGKSVQEYEGPRNANGIVEYLKKQVGPASYEIKSSEDARNLVTEQKSFVVGVFSELSGEEFANFTILAEKLRSDYHFGHTLDARLLPRGDSTVNQPTIRLFKPFDGFVVDFSDFHVDAMEKFVEEESVPVLTIFNKVPVNLPFVTKFLNNPNAKAMLFLNFNSDNFEAFKSKYQDVAEHYQGKNISFLLGDLEASQSTFEYFGLKEDQVPVIIIQKTGGKKYLKQKLEPDHIAPWLKEYMDGDVEPYTKSEPIPEVNDDPVKVVVADSLRDVVFKSGKNVMLEFYAPWCGRRCRRLAPILNEVAVSFGSDEDVVIAKIDATANEIPSDIFDVKGYPTLYFSSASGKMVQYDGYRSKEDIIEFIQKNKDTTIQSTEEAYYMATTHLEHTPSVLTNPNVGTS